GRNADGGAIGKWPGSATRESYEEEIEGLAETGGRRARALRPPARPGSEAGAGPRAGDLPAARAVFLAREPARAPEPDGACRRPRHRSGDRAGLLPPAPSSSCAP